MSEPVDGSLTTKNFIEIYNKNKTKLTKIPYLLFFTSSKCVKIATLAIKRNPIKVIKESKRKNQKKITGFS